MNKPSANGSIRARLVALLLIGALGMSILAFIVVQSVARQVAQESQDLVLSASTHSILDGAQVVQGEIMIDIPYSALSMLDSAADERVFYAIHLNNEFVSGYENLPRPPIAGRDSTVFASVDFLGDAVRIASARRALSPGQGAATLEVSVAQTLGNLEQRLTRISRISLGVGAGFFGLAALLALFVARDTIQPLRRLTASVSRRGPKDLRPVTVPVPSEMVPLVSSLNIFMERLETSLAQSEDFIAEAAHRVRTPLAIVRTQAEITLRRVEKPENRATVREMIRAIDESSRTAGQLLDHAMVTFRADHLATEKVQITALVAETIDRLRPISELKDIEIETWRAAEFTIRGDAILLQSAIRNLLDNAIKYSPAGSTIFVTVTSDETQVHLVIQDRGPGYPEAEIDTLTDRFARGKNAAGVVGSGLGLTIVKEVVEAHGGSITLKNTQGAGACVTLSFPLH